MMRVVPFELLESRLLLASVTPTPFEQYMIEMYNWVRANPNAAVARFGTAINEGPPWTPLTADPKQPLAINPILNDAARTYAQYIIDHDSVLGHEADGRNPQQRMQASGYSFTGSWGWSENAGLTVGSISAQSTSLVDGHIEGYWDDGAISGRGHRVTMLNPNLKEVGTGTALGSYNGATGFVSVQDFAYSGTSTFLTGVAYTDTSSNDFYTPGEQMSGVSVIAVRNSDSQQFSTTTWATSGGYTLALPAGTYTVWGGGGTLGGWVRYNNVTIGSQNVKLDFRPDLVNSAQGPNDPPAPPFALLFGGVLSVNGTGGDDVINLSISNGSIIAKRAGQVLTFATANVTSITVLASNGNDRVTIGEGIIGAQVSGGGGNDLLIGGSGIDTLKGDGGDDTIWGGGGNDRIYGGDGSDDLDGKAGSDRIWAGNGNDRVLGGDLNDGLWGEAGDDSLFGQNDYDTLDGGTGADWLSGGPRTDTVDYSSRTAGVYVELSSNLASPTGVSGQTNELDNVLNDIENILGGAGPDRLIGSTARNLIHGNGGNDTIYGMGSPDTLFGNAGHDRFFTADSLRDIIDGGGDVDILDGDAIETVTGVETIR